MHHHRKWAYLVATVLVGVAKLCKPALHGRSLLGCIIDSNHTLVKMERRNKCLLVCLFCAVAVIVRGKNLISEVAKK